MKKKNGFAVSGILYPILVLVIFLIAQILTVLGTRKVVLDQNSKRLLETINRENKVYTNEELSELVNQLKEENKKLTANVYTKEEVDSFMKGVQKEYSKVIDLRDSSYNINTWYPVVGVMDRNMGTYRHLRCIANIGSSGTPSWATHTNGFSVSVDLLTQLGAWGNRPARTIVFANEFMHISGTTSAVGFKNYNQGGRKGNIFYLRGGGRYTLSSDYPIAWEVKKVKYYFDENYPNYYVEPVTTNPGITATHSVVTIK